MVKYSRNIKLLHGKKLNQIESNQIKIQIKVKTCQNHVLSNGFSKSQFTTPVFKILWHTYLRFADDPYNKLTSAEFYYIGLSG